jgi:RNA polymerase sigma factor (sigma-70 family)
VKQQAIQESPTNTWSDELQRKSDPELAELMKTQKDEEALRIVIQRHATEMGYVAQRVLGEVFRAEDVEEVVSDSFLRMWNTIHLFDPEKGTVRAWLRAIVLYLSLDRRRSLVRLHRIVYAGHDESEFGVSSLALQDPSLLSDLSNVLVEQEEEQEEVARQRENLKKLQLVMERMKLTAPSDLEILTARYIEGEQSKEVAEKLHISDATARKRLQRALNRLRDAMNSQQ